MSIISNSLEYLLAVAEKIVDGYADHITVQKYYALKDSVIRKGGAGTQQSFFTLGSQKQNKSTASLRKSVGMGESKYSKREKSRPSMGRSRSRVCSKELQRGRVQTFTSQVGKGNRNIDENSGSQYLVLAQLAAVLKNAEQYPCILKTVKVTFDPLNQRLSSLITSIQQSLSAIFTNLSQPFSNQTDFLSKTPNIKSGQSDQALVDNRWLISTLQQLISQTTILRRLVGSSQS